MTPTLYGLAVWMLPGDFVINGITTKSSPLYAWISTACGLWGGLIIGISTEYFTSNTYRPVK